MDGMSSDLPKQSQDTRKSPQPSTSFTNPYTKNVESVKQDDQKFSFLPENRSAGKKRRRIRKAVTQETIYEVMSSSLQSNGQDFETSGRSALVIKISKKKIESVSHHDQLVASILHKKSEPSKKDVEQDGMHGKVKSPLSEIAVAVQKANETKSPDSPMQSQQLQKSSDQLAHSIHTPTNKTELTFQFMQQIENEPSKKDVEQDGMHGKVKSPPSEIAVAVQKANETKSPDSPMQSEQLQKSSHQLAPKNSCTEKMELTYRFMQRSECQSGQKKQRRDDVLIMKSMSTSKYMRTCGKRKRPREKTVVQQTMGEGVTSDPQTQTQKLERSANELLNICTKKTESLKQNDQRASVLSKTSKKDDKVAISKSTAASCSANGAESQRGHEDLINSNYIERQLEKVAAQQTAEVTFQEMERNPQPSTSFKDSSRMKMASSISNSFPGLDTLQATLDEDTCDDVFSKSPDNDHYTETSIHNYMLNGREAPTEINTDLPCGAQHMKKTSRHSVLKRKSRYKRKLCSSPSIPLLSSALNNNSNCLPLVQEEESNRMRCSNESHLPPKPVHNELKIQNCSINDEQLHGVFYEKNDRTASPPLDHVDISSHFNYYISMLKQKVDMLNVYSNRICSHNDGSKNSNDKISPDNFSENNCTSRNCSNKHAISNLKKDFWKYLDQIEKFMKACKEKLSHNQQKALRNELSTIVRCMNKESDASRKRKRNAYFNAACKKVKISENTYKLSPAYEPNITIKSILKALISSVHTEDYITLAKIIVWANNSSERKFIGKKLFYSVKYNEESILHILENIIEYIEKSTQRRDDIKLIAQVCVDFILYFATETKWNEAFKLMAMLRGKHINPIIFKPIVHNTSCVYVASLCLQTLFFNGYYRSATNIILSNNLILADKTKWGIDGEDDDFCITYNTLMFLLDNFFHLRLPNLIIRIFDKILNAQSTLHSPIDVSKYFGPLLLLMFENLDMYKHKALELFLTVFKLDEIVPLPGTTYRVLVTIAMNAKMYHVLSDLVNCGTEAYVYSIKEAKPNTISLSTCFLHEEMEAYIYVWCSWFLSVKNNSMRRKDKDLVFFVELKQMRNCDYKDTKDQVIPDILKSANPSLSAAIFRIKSILRNLTNMEITPNLKVRRNKIFLSCKLSACLLSSVKQILNIH